MNDAPLAFIGAGQMARALIGGLIGTGRRCDTLFVADPAPAQRAALEAQFPGVHMTADNAVAARAAAIWVLAVKPQQMRSVAEGLAPCVAAARPLVISVAAGIKGRTLSAWLGPGAAVVRLMPNRPALIGAGVSALWADAGVGMAERATAEALAAAVGTSVWLKNEHELDAVTALSGSGPAYFFRLMELLEAAGIEQGLAPAVARALAVETALGAARLAQTTQRPPGELRAEVTSAGGTTAAALAVFDAADLRGIVSRAVAAATARAAELAREYGGDAPPERGR